MLVLKLGPNQSVALFDESTGQELGRIIRLIPKDDDYTRAFPDHTPIGFELDQKVLVVRAELLQKAGGSISRQKKAKK